MKTLTLALIASFISASLFAAESPKVRSAAPDF